MNYAKTIGKDINSDGKPDIPLRFDVEYSRSAIQFPLGFCPGDRSNNNSPQINFKCIGEWGFVIKEWETIVKVLMIVTNHLTENIMITFLNLRDMCLALRTLTRWLRNLT